MMSPADEKKSSSISEGTTVPTDSSVVDRLPREEGEEYHTEDSDRNPHRQRYLRVQSHFNRKKIALGGRCSFANILPQRKENLKERSKFKECQLLGTARVSCLGPKVKFTRIGYTLKRDWSLTTLGNTGH